MNQYFKRWIIWIMAGVQLLSCVATVSAYDLSNKNQGRVVTSARVDTSIPEWFKPSTTKDINYRLQVLPFKEYRNENQYIVIPSMWMVAPIVEIDKSSNDYQNAIKGKTFEYDKYLEDGPTIYPGTASIGETGNSFLFGHSNNWHYEPGSFKTIFRLTYNLEIGDKIWVYKKVNGEWIFYEYTITISQKIAANDTWALLPEKGKKTITLSWCRPIGTARERWMNRWELTSEQTLREVLNPKMPTLRRKGTVTIKTLTSSINTISNTLNAVSYSPTINPPRLIRRAPVVTTVIKN